MQTVDQIIAIVQPAEILVKSSNYLQFVDEQGRVKTCQKDYKQKRWYFFDEVGKAECPIEEFLSFV